MIIVSLHTHKEKVGASFCHKPSGITGRGNRSQFLSTTSFRQINGKDGERMGFPTFLPMNRVEPSRDEPSVPSPQ